MKKEIIDIIIKAGSVAVTTVVTAAILEGGFASGNMLWDDVEQSSSQVEKMLNPREMRKEHWYSREKRPFNTKTGKFE